jgi:hypothetical protein
MNNKLKTEKWRATIKLARKILATPLIWFLIDSKMLAHQPVIAVPGTEIKDNLSSFFVSNSVQKEIVHHDCSRDD